MGKTQEKVVTTVKTIEGDSALASPSANVMEARVAQTESAEQVTVDPYGERRNVLYRVEQGVWLVFGIVEGLIAIRFVLRLLGANPVAGFAQFIYGLTGVFIAPFVGLFPSPRFEGSVLEVTSLVALLVYILLAWLIVIVLSLLFSETRTGIVTRSTNTRIQ